jgi:transcriptional regulator with XRE-family HTH domain
MPLMTESSPFSKLGGMRSADLIREARLRAGLTQYELAERSGRDRSVIARWEQGSVAPSVETLVELVRACGFDVPLELVPLDASADERLRKNVLLSPERRVQRLLQARAKRDRQGSA